MKSFSVFSILIFSSFFAWGADVDFQGYLRGGTGLNLEGGKQECFYNQGLPGNFLRLGNECSFYSEIAFIFHHKRPSADDPVFFRTHTRLMLGAQGTRQWEPETDRDINQIEAYVVAGGLSEIPGEIWVGKRFYRDVDLNIFDWYYYADMSGVGAGLEAVPAGPGLFSFAHLIQTNEDVETDKGKPVLQAIDLRWAELPLSAGQKLSLWGVFAWAPKGSDATHEYVATNGYSLATKIHGDLGPGANILGLMYGKGAMKDFNIYGNSAVLANDDGQNRAWSWRIVDDWHKDVTDRWAIMLALAAEYGDNGDTAKRYFYEAGIRPIYFVSDRFQWAFETGYSRISNETEKVGNELVGPRDLARVTIAPQISFSKSIWGRPVLRAYLTHSFWNDGNKSYVAQSAPTFADRTAGTSFGYQFEAWF